MWCFWTELLSPRWARPAVRSSFYHKRPQWLRHVIRDCEKWERGAYKQQPEKGGKERKQLTGADILQKFLQISATMKFWLILLGLATTLIPSFSQEVPEDSIREAENDGAEPTQPTNNGGWNWSWNWPPIFRQGPEVTEEPVRTTSSSNNNNKETGTWYPFNFSKFLKFWDSQGIPVENEENVTAEPAPTKPTTAEATTPKQRQPRINPWATCARATTEDEKKLFEALTEFSVEFYKAAIRHENHGSNLIFSPFSVAVMLSNLLLGTCDQTKDRLERLLFYPEGFTCVHRALESLQKSEALTSANAMFFQPGLPLENDFRNLTRMFYKTKMAHLTNNSNQDVTDINSWVSQSTNKKIKKIVNELDSDAKMILLNAVYFHSKWKEMFVVKDTKKGKFYRPGLSPINVQMMMNKKYPMASFIDHSLQAKVGRLQLSNNMSLVIIMPRSITQNLTEVEERLSAVVFKSVMTKLESSHIKPTVVYLPKFKVDTSQNLMDIIGDMDFGFFYDADLCEISTDKELAVSSAHHRAVLEINEEGVEAAAATVVSLARTANIFEVSQPFLVAVMRDNGFPVFMGRINYPQAE
nr:plasma protease C1 inhibitor isoform X2 [Zootoca vivipara]